MAAVGILGSASYGELREEHRKITGSSVHDLSTCTSLTEIVGSRDNGNGTRSYVLRVGHSTQTLVGFS